MNAFLLKKLKNIFLNNHEKFVGYLQPAGVNTLIDCLEKYP